MSVVPDDPAERAAEIEEAYLAGRATATERAWLVERVHDLSRRVERLEASR